LRALSAYHAVSRHIASTAGPSAGGTRLVSGDQGRGAGENGGREGNLATRIDRAFTGLGRPREPTPYAMQRHSQSTLR